MNEYEQIVRDLLQNGYAYMPIDSVLVSNASQAADKFLQSLDGDYERWALTRTGEEEPQLGVITKSKAQGFDEKLYVHVPHDLAYKVSLSGIRETPQQLVCLRLMNKLHDALKSISLNLSYELAEQGAIEPELYNTVVHTFRMSEPYNVSTLRFLFYHDVPDQTGAKAHYDKSFFSIHLGDDGGELWIKDASGAWIRASPPAGSALVFFGVKVLEATGGIYRPILHKSTTVPGKDRKAAVMFVHVDIGHEVRSAEEEYQRFFAQ